MLVNHKNFKWSYFPLVPATELRRGETLGDSPVDPRAKGEVLGSALLTAGKVHVVGEDYL